jgi:hypothetical protein
MADEKQKPEQDPVSRREFLRRSALGAAGVGLGLSGALAAAGTGKRRFYRADELTEEQRARLRAAKAQRLHQEGARGPDYPWPSGDRQEK